MAILGSIDWGFQPIDFSGSALAGAFHVARGNYLKSANDPLRFQVVWQKSGMTEATEPSKDAVGANSTTGDIVYIKFEVGVAMSDADGNTNGWDLIAEITKTRDIANKRYDTGTVAPYHRFTVDVSQVVSDELSYSLCPIGKGTWRSAKYGGMNGGGIMQDNVLSNSGVAGDPVSYFNVSKNGTFRRLRVRALAYIINSDGEIIYGGSFITAYKLTVINSVNQISTDGVYYDATGYGGHFCIDNSSVNNHKFLSRYNNYLTTGTTYGKKPVRMDEEAEFLNFYTRYASSNEIGGSAGQNAVRAMGIHVETFLSDGSAENQFYVRDFEDTLITEMDAGLSMEILYYLQERMCTQNISPSFINDYASLKEYNSATGIAFPYWTNYTGNKITSSTDCYRVSLVKFSADTPANARRVTEYRYYKIDREDEKLTYPFVRFHWLNDLGSIDSYTAKRNITEGYSISRNTIETNTTDKTWYQNKTSGGTTLDISVFISDTMRGGDIYKGGREVTNVEAQRVLSVYTEPLNTEDAKWLSKMMLSPNVWIEMDNDATKLGKLYQPLLRPSTKEYIPVIITNSDVETVNEEQGLVSFNIEYTLAHKTITQSN